MNIDLIIVTGYLILSILGVMQMGVGFLVATVLWFVVPSVYMVWRKSKIFAKTAIFSLIMGVPFGVMIDFLAHKNLTWFVPNSLFRFLDGQVAIESVVWSVVWTFFVIAFWETFVDRDKKKNQVSWRSKYFIGLVAGFVTLFVAAYTWAQELMVIPYFYLVAGLVICVLPILGVYSQKPKLAKKVIGPAIYFAVVFVAMELVALILGHWFFSGNEYVYVFNFVGHRLPIEEIVLWCILGGPGLLAWYEVFTDDLR